MVNHMKQVRSLNTAVSLNNILKCAKYLSAKKNRGAGVCNIVKYKVCMILGFYPEFQGDNVRMGTDLSQQEGDKHRPCGVEIGTNSVLVSFSS